MSARARRETCAHARAPCLPACLRCVRILLCATALLYGHRVRASPLAAVASARRMRAFACGCVRVCTCEEADRRVRYAVDVACSIASFVPDLCACVRDGACRSLRVCSRARARKACIGLCVASKCVSACVCVCVRARVCVHVCVCVPVCARGCGYMLACVRVCACSNP
jgi:hypothetical protein